MSTELQTLPGYKPAAFEFRPGRNEIIKAAEHPKIRDYPEALRNANIAITIAQIMTLMAVKNAELDETNAMHAFFNRSMGRWTFQEIRHAFDLLLEGKLNATDGRPLQPRQNLNAVVLGEVMSAYQKHKDNDLRYEKYLKEKALLAQERMQQDQEERAAIFKSMVWNTWRELKEEGTMRMGSHAVYDHFIEIGIIDQAEFNADNYLETLQLKEGAGRRAQAQFKEFMEGRHTRAKKSALRAFLQSFNSEEAFIETMKQKYKDPK